MKRLLSTTIIMTSWLMATTVSAERLELGLALTPTWLQDENFEAFSSDNLHQARFGLDIRTEVASPGGFKLLPFLGYRFSYDTGHIYYSLDTNINTHDIALGLRVRKDMLPWLAIFAEISAGALIAAMEASLVNADSIYVEGAGYIEPLRNYEDRTVTWFVGALLGAEITFSRTWLKNRGVERFCFGGEIAAGYIRRGDLSFDPTTTGQGDNALSSDSLGDWGELNPSGALMQIALDFYFF